MNQHHFWNRKNLALVSVVLIFVFGVTVVVYPLIFNPNKTSQSTPANMPMELPAK